MKSGFVAILGKPNVGKSTLLNALLSKKVSIVSPKSQTTRDSICGILTEKDYQIVFVDTPGIFDGGEALYRHMKKTAFQSARDVDAIVYVVDGSTKSLDADIAILKTIKNPCPLFILINKIDLIRPEQGMAIKAKLEEEFPNAKVQEASILENYGIKEVKEMVVPCLSGTMPYYPEDMITDKDMSYQAKEIIRQKILHFLKQEIPHQSAVIITSITEDKGALVVEAKIVVEKNNHKAIVIGKGGDMIKKISMGSRHELERMWHKHINSLEIEVDCVPNWRNDPRILKELGYGEDD
ncbi:MAG: GTPase Era [Bacilli bacterium]|nr:GTPase Era [Bacilli bacterium]